MHKLIEKYISNLTKEQISIFAIKNNCNLSDKELDNLYYIIKNNYNDIINNQNIDKYKSYFSDNNFKIIKKVFNEYFLKYHNYL